jgi:hypothetical protein
MSALTFEHKPFALDWRLPALLKRAFAARLAPGSLYTALKILPDHLLLDIGLDPRSAPVSLEEAIARPDFAHGSVVLAKGRIAAKS